MKLLIDGNEPSQSVETITEQVGQDKKYYIEGIFAQAEKKNRNGRMYPKKVLEKAVDEYQGLIKAKRAISELNHPQSPTPNPERASHLIESLKWEGNDVIGKARVLTTLPMGKIVKGLIDEGIQLGVSTRGLGSIMMREGVNIVQPDFTMTAIDVVGDPSAPDAFVRGLMESAEWVFDATTNSWVIAESIRNEIRKSTTATVIANQILYFQRFLNSIK